MRFRCLAERLLHVRVRDGSGKKREYRWKGALMPPSPSFQTLVLRVAGVTTIPLHPLSLLPNSFRVSPTDGVYEVVN
jgi:hypothetical protein